MGNEFCITSENPQVLADVLVRYARTSQDGLKREMMQFSPLLRRRIIADDWAKNWSPTDGVDTGLLRNSVKVTPLTMNGDVAMSTAGAYTPYAAIHEYGGIIPPMVIKPKNKKALFWAGAAHPVKSVKRKAVHIREKRYMRNAIDRFINDWAGILARNLSRLTGGGSE